MTESNQVGGSNAERAEGGLNPEASFAEMDRETDRRLALEAQGIPGAGMRGAGERTTGAGMASGAPAAVHGPTTGADGEADLRANLTERLRNEPGGHGAAFDRDR